MAFGKRVAKVRKDVSNDSGAVDKVSEKLSGKDNSIIGSSNSVNNNDNITDRSIKKQKIKEQKVDKKQRTYSFMKKSGNKKSEGLLFGMTKDEKLKQFIKNIKVIHPNMPDFWLEKEVDKFKKKFNIQDE